MKTEKWRKNKETIARKEKEEEQRIGITQDMEENYDKGDK